MAQKSAPAAKSETVVIKIYLQFGKANNFQLWKTYQLNHRSIEFGFQANVIKNNVPYIPRAIVPADYTPPLGSGEPALTAAALVLLRVNTEKQRNKEILQLKLSMPKFYATL